VSISTRSKGTGLIANRDSNPRGIPVAPFVEDVESFVTSRAEIEPNLKKFQEMIACALPSPAPLLYREREADPTCAQPVNTNSWR
jgi:hypothetical protein